MILDTIAAGRFSYAAGSAATVTVPAGCIVTRILTHASAGGATLTITPGGGNQSPTAGSAIPIPNAAAWFDLGLLLGELGPNTSLVFAGTDAYYVQYAKIAVGG